MPGDTGVCINDNHMTRSISDNKIKSMGVIFQKKGNRTIIIPWFTNS